MKNNKSAKNKSDISISKNHYYISLENATKRTAGSRGVFVENPDKGTFRSPL